MQYQQETIRDLQQLKNAANEVAEHFWQQTSTMHDAARIRDCAAQLRVYPDETYGTFADTWYCKHRHCPICQRQRALKWCGRMHQVMNRTPNLLTSHWVYLTLTARNCHVSELRNTLEQMIRGFNRLTRQAFWARNVIGGVRFTEVDQGLDDKQTAHPHFHCLILVRPSMFAGNNYISEERWSEEWQNCLKVSYLPKISAHRLKTSGQELRRELVRHVFYSMKPQLHLSNRGWFLEMAKQVEGLLFVVPFGEVRLLLSKRNRQKLLEPLRARDDVRRKNTPLIHHWDRELGIYKPE